VIRVVGVCNWKRADIGDLVILNGITVLVPRTKFISQMLYIVFERLIYTKL